MQYQSLLNCCCGKKSDILHLYYKLEWLQEEIEKRSSYLGKFRKTEEAAHLLDLLAMTKDEEDLFYPFAKAAMADVFDALHSRTPETEKAYRFNEGKETKVLTQVPELKIQQATVYSYTNSNKRLIISLTTDEEISLSLFQCSLTIDVPYTVNYSLLAPGSPLIEEHRTIQAISAQFQRGRDNTLAVVFYLDIPLADATDAMSAETLQSIDWNVGDDITSTIVGSSIKAINTETYSEGDYVQIGDKLYIAKADGDSNDLSALEEQPADFRKSIHYVMEYPDNLNKNMIEPLDTAVFEALVNRIIYKWLLLSYPDEAEIYLANYNETVQQIYNRFVPKNPIVYRTPRII